MIVQKKALVDHLKRIYCGGLIPDVILLEGFKAEAISTSKDLMVFTSNMEKAEKLPSEIGIINLELLIKMIELGEDDKVAITLAPEKDPNYIVIDSDGRTVKLVMASTKVIGSRVEVVNRTAIMNLIPAEAAWVHLAYRTVQGVLESMQKLSAESVTIQVGPNGSLFLVGDARQNSAQFPFPELKSEKDEYQLLIQAKLVGPVLKQLSDFTKATIALTGPDSVVGFREGPYVYIVSPDKAPVEAAK